MGDPCTLSLLRLHFSSLCFYRIGFINKRPSLLPDMSRAPWCRDNQCCLIHFVVFVVSRAIIVYIKPAWAKNRRKKNAEELSAHRNGAAVLRGSAVQNLDLPHHQLTQAWTSVKGTAEAWLVENAGHGLFFLFFILIFNYNFYTLWVCRNQALPARPKAIVIFEHACLANPHRS